MQAESCVFWQTPITSPIEIYIQIFQDFFIKLTKWIHIFPGNIIFLENIIPKKGKKKTLLLKLYDQNYIGNAIFISGVYPTWKSGLTCHEQGNTSSKTKRCKFSVQQRFPLRYLNSEWSQSAHPRSREILHKSESEMVGKQRGKGCPAPVWPTFQKT